jgi:hypothetical protein
MRSRSSALFFFDLPALERLQTDGGSALLAEGARFDAAFLAAVPHEHALASHCVALRFRVIRHRRKRLVAHVTARILVFRGKEIPVGCREVGDL